jgi:hypothetical protein
LINGTIGRNDLAPTSGARPPPRGTPLDIDGQCYVFRHLWFCDQSSRLARRLSTINIEQNIVTGGMSNTNTPIFKFLMKLALFEPAKEARHIEHCAATE